MPAGVAARSRAGWKPARPGETKFIRLEEASGAEKPVELRLCLTWQLRDNCYALSSEHATGSPQ